MGNINKSSELGEFFDDVLDDAGQLPHEPNNLVSSGLDILRVKTCPEHVVCLYHSSLPWPPILGHDDKLLSVACNSGAPFSKLILSSGVSVLAEPAAKIKDGGS